MDSIGAVEVSGGTVMVDVRCDVLGSGWGKHARTEVRDREDDRDSVRTCV